MQNDDEDQQSSNTQSFIHSDVLLNHCSLTKKKGANSHRISHCTVRKCLMSKKKKTSNHQSHILESQMESILHFVAECVSVQEMKVLQGDFHAFVHLGKRKSNRKNSWRHWTTRRGKI